MTWQKWQHVKTDINICAKGDKLQVVKSERVLALQEDNFITWKAHGQKTSNTILGKLTLLNRVKKYFPYQARKTFYHAWTTAAHSGETHQNVKYRQSQLVFKAVTGLAPDYMCIVQISLEHFDQNDTVKCKRGLVCPKGTDQHLQELYCC